MSTADDNIAKEGTNPANAKEIDNEDIDLKQVTTDSQPSTNVNGADDNNPLTKTSQSHTGI